MYFSWDVTCSFFSSGNPDFFALGFKSMIYFYSCCFFFSFSRAEMVHIGSKETRRTSTQAKQNHPSSSPYALKSLRPIYLAINLSIWSVIITLYILDSTIYPPQYSDVPVLNNTIEKII